MIKRLYFIDNLKMTAIFCVVLGHIGGITSIPWLVEIIYSFHMALFFAASSYVLAINGRVLSNKKKAQQLLIPYISICMLAITLHGFTVDAIKGYCFSSVSRFVDICNNLYLRILITEKIYDKEFDGV